MESIRKFAVIWAQQDAHEQFGSYSTSEAQEYLYARLAALNRFLDDYEEAHKPELVTAQSPRSIALGLSTTQEYEFAVKMGRFEGRVIMLPDEYHVMKGIFDRLHLLAELKGPVEDFKI